jgi:hypothetical protein
LAHLEYRAPASPRVLRWQTLRFTNESCEEAKEVSGSLEWPLSGGKLIEAGEETRIEANAPAVDCAIDGGRIRCAGTLPPATCAPAEDGPPQLTEWTEWEHAFTPTLQPPGDEDYVSQALSALIASEDFETPQCVGVPRDATSEQSRMRFELIAANANQRRVFFESPDETLRERRQASYALASHRIAADFVAGDEDEPASVCVRVRSEACGY